MKKHLGVLSLLCAAAFPLGCGGGGTVEGPPPPPPPPPVSVSVVPTSASVEIGKTQQFTATVTGTSNSAVTWTVNGVNGGNATAGTISTSGLYTGPSAVPVPADVTVTATSQADSSESGSAKVTITPPPAPTVTFTASAATITLGEPVTLTWSSTNAISCMASGAWSGAKPLAGSEVVTPGAAGNFSYTLQCDGPGGSASKSVSVTVNPAPLPTITSVNPATNATIFLASTAIIGNFQFNGTGFLVGDLIQGSPEMNILSAQLVSANQFLLTFSFGNSNHSPGWFNVKDCRADGSGCSNPGTFALLGNLNTLVRSGNELFYLNPLMGPINKFSLPTGSPDGTIPGALFQGIAVDDVTGFVLGSDVGGQIVWSDQNGNIKGSASNGKGMMAVAAKSGIGCTTQPNDGLLTCFDLTQVNPAVTSVVAGSEPWSLAMTTNGAETYAVVYSRESTELRRYKVEKVGGTVSVTLVGALTLTGITPASQIPALGGGWQLTAFDAGPSAGKAALLSQFDRTLVFVDLNSNPIVETRRVALQGIPFRIAADDVHGTIVVASADVPASLTRFADVDPTTGGVTALDITSSLLPVGLLVSSDGQSIYAVMRDQIQILVHVSPGG